VNGQDLIWKVRIYADNKHRGLQLKL